MSKAIVALLACIFSSIALSMPMGCPSATSSNSSGFCSSFKLAAECHCTLSGLPRGMCMDMSKLYERMIGTFGSVKNACNFQHDTDVQTCIDDWSCYRSGGKNSKNELCSGTGAACV